MFFKQKREYNPSSYAEHVTESILKISEEALLSITLFGHDNTLNALFQNKPALLVLFKSGVSINTILTSLEELSAEDDVQLLFFNEDELAFLQKEMPLELLYLRSGSSTVYGDELHKSLSLEKADIKKQVIRELISVIAGLRQGFVTGVDYASLICSSMNRLLITFQGVHYLRGSGKGTGWSWLVNSVEDDCDLHDLTLSGIIAAVESRDAKKFQELYLPFIQTLEQLKRVVHNEDVTA